MIQTISKQSIPRIQDPRIDSPDIKVIYPSEEEPQTLPQNEPVKVQSTTNDSTQAATDVESSQDTSPSTTDTEITPAPTWKDTLKEHTNLFLIVGGICLLVGMLIGKNFKS